MLKILSVAQKKLHRHLRGKGGRGSDGAITVYHRGATKYKRIYRRINFKVEDNTEAVVLSLHYDSNRTSNVAFVYYSTGYCSYTIAAEGLRIGSTFFLGGFPEKLEEVFTIGACLPLRLLPIGFVVHNIELEPFVGAKICRAAGSYAIILKKTDFKVLIKLPSGWNMWLHEGCFATLGVVSNSGNSDYRIPKAGIVRNWGLRPIVRGIAKNPVDHPHGGRSNKGQHPTTPWGRLTKGQPTVSRKRRAKKQVYRFK